jgi:hypothetical protein
MQHIGIDPAIRLRGTGLCIAENGKAKTYRLVCGADLFLWMCGKEVFPVGSKKPLPPIKPDAKIFFEDSSLVNQTFRKSSSRQKYASNSRDAGKNQGLCILISQMCAQLEITCIGISPADKPQGISPKILQNNFRAFGYDLETTTDQEDEYWAAVFCYCSITRK